MWRVMKGLVPRAHSLFVEFRFASEFLEEVPVVNGSFSTSIGGHRKARYLDTVNVLWRTGNQGNSEEY